MSDKRMLSSQIVGSDAFLDLPLTAQALYFHLNMNADDDGFINSPKRVQRMIGASPEDLELLFEKRFLLRFESGAAVVKHWLINNSIRADRKKQTAYTEELSQLKIKPNGAYTLATDNQLTTKPQPNDRINKDNIDKDNIKQVNNKTIDHRSGDRVAEDQPQIVTLIEKRFDEFWTLYPRKVGKLKAYQSFKKINPNAELFAKIMDALQDNLDNNANWRRDNGQYIPHPTTWLNQGRWDDVIANTGTGAANFFERALRGEVDY